VGQVRFTRYFLEIRTRSDRAVILEEWIQRALVTPIREEVQADGRIRRWAQIPEMEGRFLRVVLLPDGETIHNAFFDRVQAMKIKYFAETDTLYIEFREGSVAETRDLDENTLLDMDSQGNICAITIEHASARTGIPEFSYEQILT
jgi:uncharacterized protein YuzE